MLVPLVNLASQEVGTDLFGLWIYCPTMPVEVALLLEPFSGGLLGGSLKGSCLQPGD